MAMLKNLFQELKKKSPLIIGPILSLAKPNQKLASQEYKEISSPKTQEVWET